MVSHSLSSLVDICAMLTLEVTATSWKSIIFSSWFDFSSSQIRTRDGWVWSANATTVLCRPPKNFNDEVGQGKDRHSCFKDVKCPRRYKIFLPTPGFKLTSVELHPTGTFEGRSTDWAAAGCYKVTTVVLCIGRSTVPVSTHRRTGKADRRLLIPKEIALEQCRRWNMKNLSSTSLSLASSDWFNNAVTPTRPYQRNT